MELFKYDDLEKILFKNNEFKLPINDEVENNLFENDDELFILDQDDKLKKSKLIARGLIKSVGDKKVRNIRIIEVDLYKQTHVNNYELKKISKSILLKSEKKIVQLLIDDEASYVRRFWYANYSIAKEEIDTRFSLVSSIEEIKNNMQQFNADLHKYDKLKKDLPRFQQWYYIHEDGLIAPSKFIGYKNMNGILYTDKNAIAWTDGRDTEHRLSRWFVPYENTNLENYIREYFGTSLRKTIKIKVLESEIKIIEKKFGKDVESIELPLLKSNNRDREFKKYSDELKGQVLYEHLINSKTHRWLDKNVLGVTNGNTKGRNSANILYYLGMKADYRGIFNGKNIDEVISILMESNQDYSIAVELLKNTENRVKELLEIVDLDIKAEQVEEGYSFEGGLKYYHAKRYERSAKNRTLAIKKLGVSCMACGFNFEKAYGEHGKDFIEVHHIQALSTLDKATMINPEVDLIPLCANCHRMIHRKKDQTLSLLELIKLINREK